MTFSMLSTHAGQVLDAPSSPFGPSSFPVFRESTRFLYSPTFYLIFSFEFVNCTSLSCLLISSNFLHLLRPFLFVWVYRFFRPTSTFLASINWRSIVLIWPSHYVILLCDYSVPKPPLIPTVTKRARFFFFSLLQNYMYLQ